MNIPKPVALIILDGWGYRPEREANAIQQANTPTFDRLWQEYPHTVLNASGTAVGLPEGQMGNSEVGHLNLGAGRVVYQDLSRISNAIENGDFFKNPVFIETIKKVKREEKALHIFGLLSPGGIHSHTSHIEALLRLAQQQQLTKVYVHAFLDGRDTPPKSALIYLQQLNNTIRTLQVGKIVSLVGRFYAMDRDTRWDRIEKAYDLLTVGEAERVADTVEAGLELAYAAGETDEFVKPTSIHAINEDPITINDGDAIIFMNFRADRTREITRALTEANFQEFHRKKIVHLSHYVCLTQYDEQMHLPIAFPPQKLENTLGEYLASQHKRQLRIAETEKYAHVTFFLNGGVETANHFEDRMLIPSPKISTYDLQPQMSAEELTQELIKAIHSKQYDLIICNYANPDMVGHTGNFEATVKSIECIDNCLAKIIAALHQTGGEAIITADHGNAELMYDPGTQQAHTAHTNSLVPFIYVGRPATIEKNNFALCDISPTLLYLMDLPIPNEMTGKSIVQLKNESL